MIRKVMPSESNLVINVVNDAALAYKGVIPADCWREPYMTVEELHEEIVAGVNFYGWFENDALVAVMGIQAVKDVTLIRHAYVLTSFQRKGFGEKLLRYLMALAMAGEVLVGTWAAALWAVRFYEKNGFRVVPMDGRGKLRQYWSIPDRQAQTSVVLKFERQI